MNKHVSEAIAWDGRSWTEKTDDLALVAATRANLHATLALVEEQRTATLAVLLTNGYLDADERLALRDLVYDRLGLTK